MKPDALFLLQYYLVVRVCEELSGNSQFPSEDFSTYVSYFKEKYNVSVKQPKHPLLLVKALSQRLNCLKPRGQTGRKRNKLNMYEEMEEHHIPELCVTFSFPSALWIQASLLPSLIFKLLQFLRINSLRQRIALDCDLGQPELDFWQTWRPQSVDQHALKEVPEPKTKKPDKPRSPAEDEAVAMDHLDITGQSMENNRKLSEEFANRLLESQFPWKDFEEPIDIFKNIDEVTALDINDFVNFTAHKVDAEDVKRRNEPARTPSKTLPALEFPREYKEKRIAMIEDKDSVVGVELADLFQAFSTAKANDIVNLERFETLGDSFLKFAASVYLLQRFPHFDEGKLTTVKGQVVSNRNLHLLALRRGLQRFIKNADILESQWIPPGYVIPAELTERIDNKELPINRLFNIIVPREDQSAGNFREDFMHDLDLVIDEPDYEVMCIFQGKQLLPDKTISDCAESLLGVYLQEFGCSGALKILHWLGAVPPLAEESGLYFTKSFRPQEVDFFIPHYKLVEEQLGYKFKNRAYLLQALTHASFTPNRVTNCYQRLEFLGDAVLDFLITCYIYESCGNLTPGDLTDLRSSLVNNITFAGFTVRCGFHKFLLALNPKLVDIIDNFVQFQEQRNYDIGDEILILLEETDVNIAEHIDVPKVLGDLFEALAGAVYLDSGMCLKTTWKVFYKIMWKEIDKFSMNVPRNLIRRLFETKGAHPQFLKSRRNETETTLVPLEFMLNGEKKTVHGFGDTKNGAKKAAAKIALRLISITKNNNDGDK